MPATRLHTSGRDRLCLTSWRGFMIEGAAAVFLRCPQGAGRRWRSSRHFEWVALPQQQPIAAAAHSEAPAGKHHPRHRSGGSSESDHGRKQGSLHEGMVVRVKPRDTPHLCLSAPPVPHGQD